MILVRFSIILILLVALFSSNLSFIKQYFFSSINFQDEMSKLELENDSLRARLYIDENLVSSEKKQNNWDYYSVKIFSSYPFNNQSLISINGGSEAGIKIGQPVVANFGILLGEIDKINTNFALVRTIFDKNFIAAVKIGENRINALLKGGIPPTLEMIEKNKDIKNRDIVYNADPAFPYGFKIGEVQIVEDSQNNAEPFKKAILKINYNLNSLNEVWVIKNFESLKN